MIDLLDFFCPADKYSVPVGVTQQPGGEAIYQVEHDAATRIFWQIKGTHGIPAQSQKHGYDAESILLYADNSPKSGIPYAQRDDLTKPGAVWARRRQNVGDVTERNPYLLELDPATGVARTISQSPIRTWLKFAARHRDWQSANGGPVIDEVIVLEWYLDAALTVLEETYVYGRDDEHGALGLIEFRHAGQSAWPNHVWFAAPPAEHVPVMTRKPMPPDSVPAVIVAPPVVTPPVVTPPATAAELMVRADITAGANVRREPTTRSPTFVTLPRLTPVDVVRFVPGGDGDGFRWAERAASGYIREDLLGPRSAPVTRKALFPCPVHGAYSVTTHHGEGGHKGVDLGAARGTPVRAGGVGQVAFLHECVKCRTIAETWAAAGLTAAQRAAAFNDPDWGYGYGDSVVVRYAYGDLPDAARAEMDRQGLTGGYVYVIHAHLDAMHVAVGQCVGPETQLGTVGQDANSSGPHLHLEPRVSLKPDETSLYNRTLLDPALIYTW